MDAVLGVFVGVVQVHFRRVAEIPVRLVHHAQARGHDAENAGGQGGIVGGHLFIVGVGPADGFQVLLLLQDKVGQHRVRLLAHLIPVKLQGMVVQQQGFVLLRYGGNVPHFFLEEGIVLGIDAQLLVVGQENRLRGAHKLPGLLLRHTGPVHKAGGFSRLAQFAVQPGRPV